jgi:hypothetical protein
MNTDATNLLKSLAAGARIGAVGSAAAGGVGGVTGEVESGQFADLLRRAQAGELNSSRPVTVANDAGVKLSDDQLARISLAADRAEVAGVRTALVLIDSQAFRLDVANRTILGKADLSSGVLGGIDGFIDLSPGAINSADEAATVTVANLARGGLPGPSLAALLAEREGQSERAA